jgi:pyruvyltransferase
MSNVIKAWWWKPKTGINFGDELGAFILRKMGYKIKRVGLKNADLVMVGTILDTVSKRAKDGCKIIGIGASWSNKVDNRFDVISVRGKITAESLGVDTQLGDLGILTSRLLPRSEVKYNIGVVRHYIDKNDYSWADIVIDATEKPKDVIQKISSCKCVLSSSLHGLIVADSYGIPSMRIHHPDVMSGDIKWIDYQTSLVEPIEFIQDQLIIAIRKALG